MQAASRSIWYIPAHTIDKESTTDGGKISCINSTWAVSPNAVQSQSPDGAAEKMLV